MKILVTGATANIGRRIVDHLVDFGADDIRALSNHPERTAFPAEVEVVKGYVKTPSSLPAAFESVDRMYLTPSVETVTEVLALAVEKSGVGWTHLWTGEFMENAVDWSEQIRATGEVREPYPDSGNAPIAMDDIARVAATVLVGEGHLGETLELTGPETITRAQRLQYIAEAIGRDLAFVTVPPEEVVAQLRPAMGDYADYFVNGLAARVSNPQIANSTVADLTGDATTFATWAAANVELFR